MSEESYFPAKLIRRARLAAHVLPIAVGVSFQIQGKQDIQQSTSKDHQEAQFTFEVELQLQHSMNRKDENKDIGYEINRGDRNHHFACEMDTELVRDLRYAIALNDSANP